jgi:hypothetical protein
MPGQITYMQDLEGVDWEEMKTTLAQDDFDNARSRAMAAARNRMNESVSRKRSRSAHLWALLLC